MPLPLLFKADGIHFQQTAVGNVADFHTDTCRTVFTHERRVHFVECGKIVHVGDKHRRLGDVGDGKAGGFEHGLHVRQRLDGLFFHAVADDFPGNGVKGDLTAQVIGGTGLDAMGIGADRRAGLGRMNEFHNKSFGGGRRFTAERFLTASQSTYGSKSGIARESSPGRGLHSGAWLSPRAQETILPCLRARAADMQPPSHVALF